MGGGGSLRVQALFRFLGQDSVTQRIAPAIMIDPRVFMMITLTVNSISIRGVD
jgi:hypothetical protein